MIKSDKVAANTAGPEAGMILPVLPEKKTPNSYNYWLADRYQINNTPACAAVKYKNTATRFL